MPGSPDTNTNRPRGRPRAFDREAALAQATHLFWERGFEATSMADLLEVMGIGSPSLYAAFGSKEELYVEALRQYGEHAERFFWTGFRSAATARDAVAALLYDSAAALTGCASDTPRGCMVTLASFGGGDHFELSERMRSMRAIALDRLKERVGNALATGELPASTDVHALARFIQTIQSGMSILARDGASHADLDAVARVAMARWDAIAEDQTSWQREIP